MPSCFSKPPYYFSNFLPAQIRIHTRPVILYPHVIPWHPPHLKHVRKYCSDPKIRWIAFAPSSLIPRGAATWPPGIEHRHPPFTDARSRVRCVLFCNGRGAHRFLLIVLAPYIGLAVLLGKSRCAVPTRFRNLWCGKNAGMASRGFNSGPGTIRPRHIIGQ